LLTGEGLEKKAHSSSVAGVVFSVLNQRTPDLSAKRKAAKSKRVLKVAAVAANVDVTLCPVKSIW